MTIGSIYNVNSSDAYSSLVNGTSGTSSSEGTDSFSDVLMGMMDTENTKRKRMPPPPMGGMPSIDQIKSDISSSTALTDTEKAEALKILEKITDLQKTLKAAKKSGTEADDDTMAKLASYFDELKKYIDKMFPQQTASTTATTKTNATTSIS